MKLHQLCSLVFLFALSAALAAETQTKPEAEAIEELEVVTVNGVTDPAFLPYASALKALAAFDKHRALAPAAMPRFKLVLKQQTIDPSCAALALGLVGSEGAINIPLAADGSFTVPHETPLVGEGADLLLNRSRSLYRVFPDIRSPGVPGNARRLGDLRLECEMIWSYLKAELGLVTRTTLVALGGACHTGLATFTFRAPARLSGAALVFGDRREALTARRLPNNGLGYAPPLHDRSWPDDTLVEFESAPVMAGVE